MFQLDKIAGVFTDDGIPKEAEDILQKSGIFLNKVPCIEEKLKWRYFPGQFPLLFTEKEG